MVRNRQQRSVKTPEKTSHSRRRRTRLCSDWNVRMRLRANFLQKRLLTWLLTESAPHDCGKLRNFWFIAARDAALALFSLYEHRQKPNRVGCVGCVAVA